MKQAQWRLPILSMAMAIAGISIMGCSGSENIPTYKVSGVVTLDGKPVEGATVTFLDVDNGPYNAVALTGSDGRYELTTFENGDGAVEGSYNVMVTKYGKEEEVSPYETGGEAAPTIEEGDAEAYEDAYGSAMENAEATGWRPPKTWNDIPDKYAAAATSGLTYTVKPESDGQTFNLELVSK